MISLRFVPENLDELVEQKKRILCRGVQLLG